MIETFLIEDAEKLIAEPEQLDEWQRLVDEIGLEGQKELAKPNKSPIPFPMMKEVERRVYETLCPNKTKAREYKNNSIPLRVLSLIALSQKEEYFNEIQIWDDHATPDPIAVGVIPDKSNSWVKSYYIIARWGDELRSFAELKQLAIKRFIEEKSIRLKKEISQATNNLSQIESLANQHFIGEWTGL